MPIARNIATELRVIEQPPELPAEE